MKLKFDVGVQADFALPMQGKVTVEKNYFVGAVGDTIVYVGPFKKSLQASCKKFIPGRGKVLLPGLINAHTHLAMTLFRGLEDDAPLKKWLFERIFPLEAEFVSGPFVKTGVELAALECIRFGTTMVSDMYFFNKVATDVWDKAGLRGIFCQAMMSFPIPEDKTLGPDRFARFDELHLKYRNHSRIQIGLAPHAPYTCEPELLKKVVERSHQTNSMIHIHLAEAPHEVPDSMKQYGKTPVEHLESLGVLGPRTICAHSIHLSESDRKIMKRTGARVVHNPDSNAKLGSGIAPIKEYLSEGIPVALGTDGSASKNDLSLFGAMDVAAKLQKLKHSDSAAITAAQVLWMATQGGAEALGMGEQIGSLEVGKKADFILVDFNFPHLQPIYDPTSHLVYSAKGLEVDTVFCAGKMLLKDKKFVSLKPDVIIKKAAGFQKKIHHFVSQLKSL